MKVGDLVKWTHPKAPDIGIILQAGTTYDACAAHIYWLGKPEHSGVYPMVHDLLEIFSESR